ncbi:MAG TPA: metal ABC transporter ATP-binding protein [Candidatus Hydrogenedentes bacterium]|nr:metal ABC transporter ATP-binding protein [Candidatus Hydrogenedentota bacterium]HOL75492.1 metal ABC transporter ATP-binding protein [Candidatus Hydrogenedentota bacterium]HPO86066.1 metal ABC transporter ATP-binding protein [Candidatus Hydrogenedentota bacterium]
MKNVVASPDCSQNMQPVVLEFRNVSFSYGIAPVLENVSFTIRKGDMTCIVGPNGGGKTTILKLALGLIQPQQGEINLLGSSPPTNVTRVGYSPQYIHYDPRFPMTVIDIVLTGRLGNALKIGYSKADKETAKYALEQVGLLEKMQVPFGSLSGGQRQRVLLARALACEPELLLLDEPTSNVDAASEVHFQEILERMKQHVTLVLVTHDLAFVSGLTTSVLCVNRRVLSHSTGELSEQVLREMYGNDIKLVKHDPMHRR